MDTEVFTLLADQSIVFAVLPASGTGVGLDRQESATNCVSVA